MRRDQICGVEIPDTVDPIRFAGRPDKYNVYTYMTKAVKNLFFVPFYSFEANNSQILNISRGFSSLLVVYSKEHLDFKTRLMFAMLAKRLL